MKRTEIIERTNTQFSHRHWCDVYGHEYECSGDCLCICGRPMSGNDHSDCPVELRPCPEHRAEQERCIAEAISSEKQTEIEPLCEQQDAALPHCECGRSDIEFAKIVAWCFHCNHVYANYTPALRPPLPRRARNREGSSTGEISQSGNVSGGLAQQNHTGGITQWTSSTTKARKSSRLTTAVSNEKSITISKRSVYDKFTHGVEFRKLAVVGRSSCDLAAVSACCSECCL